MPDVPTFAEAGYPQVTVSNWMGYVAPKGTPPEVLAKLEAALQKAVMGPEFKAAGESAAAAAGVAAGAAAASAWAAGGMPAPPADPRRYSPAMRSPMPGGVRVSRGWSGSRPRAWPDSTAYVLKQKAAARRPFRCQAQLTP